MPLQRFQSARLHLFHHRSSLQDNHEALTGQVPNKKQDESDWIVGEKIIAYRMSYQLPPDGDIRRDSTAASLMFRLRRKFLDIRREDREHGRCKDTISGAEMGQMKAGVEAGT